MGTSLKGTDSQGDESSRGERIERPRELGEKETKIS